MQECWFPPDPFNSPSGAWAEDRWDSANAVNYHKLNQLMTPISAAFPTVVSLLTPINTTSGTWSAFIALTNTGHLLGCSLISHTLQFKSSPIQEGLVMVQTLQEAVQSYPTGNWKQRTYELQGRGRQFLSTSYDHTSRCRNENFNSYKHFLILILIMFIDINKPFPSPLQFLYHLSSNVLRILDFISQCYWISKLWLI